MNKLKQAKTNDEWADRRVKHEMERQFLVNQQFENRSRFDKTISGGNNDKIVRIFENQGLKSKEGH